MGHIFCVMGKSATGKDTIYGRLLADETLGLEKIVTYTTRPIRAGEKEGVEYHFTDEEGYKKFDEAGKVIEARVYNTVHGPWRYFTVDDGNINFDNNYLMIGTLEAYKGLRDYFGEEKISPIYIEIEDGERLTRALGREKQQQAPKYNELCRRFLADSEDFSEEKLSEVGITFRFENDKLDNCLEKIKAFIRG